MMRTGFFVPLFGLIWIGSVFSANAWAQERADLFVIYDVASEATGSSSITARQNAVDGAINRAYNILINRVVAPESRSSVRRPSPVDLQRLLRGFEVEDERAAAGKYAARFHIAFDDQLMVEWLQASNVPFVMRGLGATMLYMVWTDETGSHLYTEASDTLELAATGWRNRIGLYRIPYGTLKDRLMMPISRIIEADEVSALVHADTREADRAVFVFASEVPHDPSGLRAIKYEYRLVPDDIEGEHVIRALPGEDALSMRARAFQRALDHLDDKLMADLQVGQGQEGVIRIHIDTPDLSVLSAFRQAISGLPMVDSFKIESVGLPVSVVELRFEGRMSLIQKVLDQAGFDVWRKSDSEYRAKPKPAARPPIEAIDPQ